MPCTTLKREKATLECMAVSTYYRYRDRDDERGSTFSDIRHHPMATYDTVAHVCKRMWDLESSTDEAGRPVGDAKAWQELRAHLERMMGQALEYTPDPHDHSARDEWLHEREAAPDAAREAEK